jgi:1,3-propanediol dehydrogenase
MFFQYSQPSTVIFGRGAISALGEKIKELGCKKAMCVYDEGTEKAGIAGKAMDSIRAAGIEVVGFNGVIPDPTVDVVNKGGDVAKANGVDCLVGVGGGSSLDTAKAISVLLTMPGKAEDYILAHPIFIDTKTPVFLVPTTAGTGSEITKVAIISRPELNAKWSVFVNTNYAIVDPELTLTLPKSQTASTGLDALSHAMEAMTGTNWNPHSDLVGEAAIKKIAVNLPKAYHEPSNIEARTEMSLAANFAGLAFNDPICHVGHSAADALSCRFHTAHGYNCAMALPPAMKLVAPAVPEKMRVIAAAMNVPLKGNESDEQLGVLVADSIRKLMRDVEIKSLKEMGFKREDVLALAPDVVNNHLASYCPVTITEDVARNLLAEIYDDYQ